MPRQRVRFQDDEPAPKGDPSSPKKNARKKSGERVRFQDDALDVSSSSSKKIERKKSHEYAERAAAATEARPNTATRNMIARSEARRKKREELAPPPVGSPEPGPGAAGGGAFGGAADATAQARADKARRRAERERFVEEAQRATDQVFAAAPVSVETTGTSTRDWIAARKAEATEAQRAEAARMEQRRAKLRERKRLQREGPEAAAAPPRAPGLGKSTSSDGGGESWASGDPSMMTAGARARAAATAEAAAAEASWKAGSVASPHGSESSFNSANGYASG